MNLNHLTDAELLRIAYAQLDPITSTDLERELLNRMGQLLDAADGYAPVADHLDEFDFTKTKDVERCKALLEIDLDAYRRDQALLDTLAEYDIDDPALLERSLSRLIKLDDLMHDLAQPLATLQTFTTTE